jgi:hypothetical protein
VNEKAQRSLRRLRDMFERDELPQAVALSLIERQHTDAPISRWSMMSRLICLVHGTNDARTFKQWETVGRHPVKGSKALHLFSPLTKRVEDEESEDAYRSIVRCISYAGSPARKGRSLKRIPVLIVMALVMLVGGYRTWG